MRPVQEHHVARLEAAEQLQVDQLQRFHDPLVRGVVRSPRPRHRVDRGDARAQAPVVDRLPREHGGHPRADLHVRVRVAFAQKRVDRGGVKPREVLIEEVGLGAWSTEVRNPLQILGIVGDRFEHPPVALVVARQNRPQPRVGGAPVAVPRALALGQEVHLQVLTPRPAPGQRKCPRRDEPLDLFLPGARQPAGRASSAWCGTPSPPATALLSSLRSRARRFVVRSPCPTPKGIA